MVPAALQKLNGQFPVLQNIDLEHFWRRNRLAHFLDTGCSQRRQTVKGSKFLRGFRRRNLFIVMEQTRHAGRGEENRQIQLLAKNRGFQINVFHILQVARQQLVVVKRAGVAP